MSLAGIVRLGVLALVSLCMVPAGAQATLVIKPGTTTLEIVDKLGQPEDRAGAHPDRLIQGFEFADTGGAPEYVKDLVIEMPAGLSGDPDAVPICPRAVIRVMYGTCPDEFQVGRLRSAGEDSPVFNVEPGPNEAATFATATFFAPLTFSAQLRPADQGLTLLASNLEHLPFAFSKPITGGVMELWGVPADHQNGGPLPRRAFLTTPTRCDTGPLEVTVSMRTWQHPDLWQSDTGDTGRTLTGCGDLHFEPRLGFSLGNPSADAPTGAGIDIDIPQNDDPDGRVSSQLRDVEIVMPEGMTVSPGGASELGACSDAQFGLGAPAESACPGSSQVGTVELTTPSAAEPMVGAIYVGAEHPGDRFRILMALDAPGSEVKFVGSLRADPETGRLTTSLRDFPEVTFGHMSLRFDGGPDALLASPLSCGPAGTSAKFVPYSGSAPVDWAGSVGIAAPGGKACGGPPPFAPTFSGGSTRTRAGHPTSFTATVRRRDGEQLPARLVIAMPPGMSAALGTVKPCSTTTACSPASRVGSASAELGPGPHPAQMSGDIYLTGPYRRAPFGIALVFRAAFGPFDLGSLVVRGTLRVDPLSGRVTVQTDALPTIFEGVPIRFQTIGLDLDRPNFVRNPTSCGAAKVTASLKSSAGALASPSTPFTVRDCIDLPFRPHFSLALSGRAELRKEGKPSLRISAKVPAGNANLRRADIAFPGLLKFDAGGLREICARRQAMAGHCPPRSRVGSGHGRSLLLDVPMKGGIYAVEPRGSGLPDIWTILSGEGLRVALQGETAVTEGRAETKLVHVPDFPLDSLTMRLAGGEHGLLKLRRNPCAIGARLVAPMELAGQNGARAKTRTRVAVQDCMR